MIVLRYELECGQTLEVIVPAHQLLDTQVFGTITAWWPRCNRTEQAARVQLTITP